MLADQLILDADGDVHEGEGVQLGQHHMEPLHHLLAIINSGLRIRIHLIRIRIQHFRLNTDPDRIQCRSGSNRIQGFNDQNLKKITAGKKI
jgi:hypothetical protein